MRPLRGTGYKHTLPAAFRFGGIWVVVVVLTAPIMTIGMMAGGMVPPANYPDVWFFLLTRVPVLALAAIGLAVFTTNRNAGPMVALRMACDDVKGGDMGRRVRFRKSDKHYKPVETAFNEMMDSLSERVDPQGGLEAEDSAPGSTG